MKKSTRSQQYGYGSLQFLKTERFVLLLEKYFHVISPRWRYKMGRKSVRRPSVFIQMSFFSVPLLRGRLRPRNKGLRLIKGRLKLRRMIVSIGAHSRSVPDFAISSQWVLWECAFWNFKSINSLQFPCDWDETWWDDESHQSEQSFGVGFFNFLQEALWGRASWNVQIDS